MKYEVGKTYTLTGDEPRYGTEVPLSSWCGSEYFPTSAEVTEIDYEGDVWLKDKATGYVFVVDSSTNTDDTEQEMVNHPPHYNGHPKGIEAIDVIEDNPFMNLGNAMKYLWRVSWGSKGHDDEDLAKAIWYIERERSRRAKEN